MKNNPIAPTFANRDDCRQFIANFNKEAGDHLLAQPRKKTPDGWQPVIRNVEAYAAQVQKMMEQSAPQKPQQPPAVKVPSSITKTMISRCLCKPNPESNSRRPSIPVTFKRRKVFPVFA